MYELDEELRPVKHYYLADEETVKAAIAAVQNQVRPTSALIALSSLIVLISHFSFRARASEWHADR